MLCGGSRVSGMTSKIAKKTTVTRSISLLCITDNGLSDEAASDHALHILHLAAKIGHFNRIVKCPSFYNKP